MNKNTSLVWLRRDLRLEDNNAIYEALQSDQAIVLYFNFDVEILEQLENKKDSRVSYIHNTLEKINLKLKEYKSKLIISYGRNTENISEVIKNYKVTKLFAAKDYEPIALKRDREIEELCRSLGVEMKLVKDQVIFEEKEIVKKDGLPYTVCTPYMKKWRELFTPEHAKESTYQLKKSSFLEQEWSEIISLKDIGFEESELEIPGMNLSLEMLTLYDERRNFPAMEATSNLGLYLRFGTISIRECVRKALKGHPQFLNELIWREFFMQILYNFPKVEKACFKPKYNEIEWENNIELFEKWCEGKTGYPIVDAGMRELKASGRMHNRVRMITASFLCKHLLIDWRWGEAWFANLLLDFDLAANNGNWQWVAGCGCDAAPYFRIFNPYEQQKRFDPDWKYIRKWIPEIDSDEYPKEIVEHKFARNRALERYKIALQ